VFVGNGQRPDRLPCPTPLQRHDRPSAFLRLADGINAEEFGCAPFSAVNPTGQSADEPWREGRIMRFWRRLLKDERGQTTTEYMLIIGVIVAAILAAAYVFIDPFKEGVNTMAKNIKDTLSQGFKSK
jgi:Flp pilus assembly pilin Flp